LLSPIIFFDENIDLIFIPYEEEILLALKLLGLSKAPGLT
jgi:hypothetical protein